MKMKAVTYIVTSLLLVLAGCSGLVENALQHENREMYYNGEISYSEYQWRDNYLDQVDEQFGKGKK